MRVAGNINLKNRAVTQFMNYPFNSFCNFKGRQLAASTDGLFVLSGDLDHETSIDAFIETVLSDWGAIQNKRVRFVYLSYNSSGTVEVSLLDHNFNKVASRDFEATDTNLPEVKQVAYPRTEPMRFWKFRIENKDGADFSVHGLSAMFVVRPHGVSKTT